MQNSLNTVCDFCATIVEGRSGTAEIHKDYISFRGSMCLTTYSKDSDFIDYTYAADKGSAQTTFMHFCIEPGKNCLMDFLKAKKFLKDEHRKEFQYQD